METLPFTFLLKKFVSALLLPPLMPLLCIAIGLLLLRRRPRFGRVLAWGGLSLTWLLSTPAFVDLIAKPLENVPVLQARDLERAEAIVILGAGAHRYVPEYGGSAPTRLALERLRYGARLARVSKLPVILSGEIEPMANALWMDFGVLPRWVDANSLDTEDNARNTTAILRNKGIRRVVMVTHAAHMRRAIGEFIANGVEVIPAPVGFYSAQKDEDRNILFEYLPGPTAAFAGWYVAHEWMGLLALRLRLFAH